MRMTGSHKYFFVLFAKLALWLPCHRKRAYVSKTIDKLAPCQTEPPWFGSRGLKWTVSLVRRSDSNGFRVEG